MGSPSERGGFPKLERASHPPYDAMGISEISFGVENATRASLGAAAWRRNDVGAAPAISDALFQPNRSVLSPEIWTDGVSPDTISETSFPVTAPRLTPIMAWPEATIMF